MKSILVIFMLSFVVMPSFAQQKLSRADSLVLTRIKCIGPWLGTYYISQEGIRIDDANAPLWPLELVIDSFAEKSLNPKEAFDFIEANIKLLYKRFGDELYFISVTNKEVIWINVRNGKPEIFDRTVRVEGNYYFPSIYYIERIPGKNGKVKVRNK